jgi:GNAT superfamily N-acetyltransferase
MNIYMNGEFAIDYRISPEVSNEKLNELFAAVWVVHTFEDINAVLAHSLAYICAFHLKKLVGFVNLAWDGGIHAFILDTAVHPDYHRRGIGIQLVKQAVSVAKERRINWVHVDFEPHLQEFYARCGFRHTSAGLIDLHE